MFGYNSLSEEEQIKVVQEDGYLIYYIKNPSEEVQLAAVKQNGRSIRYIKEPTELVQLTAVKEDGCTIYYINNPTKNVLDYVIYEWNFEEKFFIGYVYSNFMRSDEERTFFKLKYGSFLK